jgi:hypothetical protein
MGATPEGRRGPSSGKLTGFSDRVSIPSRTLLLIVIGSRLLYTSLATIRSSVMLATTVGSNRDLCPRTLTLLF